MDAMHILTVFLVAGTVGFLVSYIRFLKCDIPATLPTEMVAEIEKTQDFDMAMISVTVAVLVAFVSLLVI